jgi:thiol peroxidase
LISGGPLDRLDARAVFVVGPDNKVKYVEYVRDIAEQPSYDAALAAHDADLLWPRNPVFTRLW